ncbi:Protein of unknown function [Faunimonas pinastri]|uniref:DUF995 domain-containing protein n=1 Tax=Faunimonas pinastri TaxID=1855383 RepID=A0A1H9ID79_9HYPH|nr:DUF995 domain-containing protein [Faunimonas pinastri]SEQ72681.1 Protein of unknown function [Faunimonas pinastri]
MMPINRAVAAILMGAAAFGSLAASAAGKPQIPSGRQPSPVEIRAMFSGRQWVWPDGVGILAADGTFTARAFKGNTAWTSARGAWFPTSTGQICFRAVWFFKGGQRSETTCHSHRKIGRMMQEERDSLGRWYPFKTNPGRADDEINNLMRRDLALASH